MQCSRCGHVNVPQAKFCVECGVPLALPAAAAPERRQLTVMFCDLVGSTELSERLDPEDLRDVVREYQSTCADIIKRFDGWIAQYLGDGLLVYFGLPHAHEDDARRAGHAALGILRAMDALSARLATTLGIRLAVRIGIHTGLVVAGEVGGKERTEQLAIGETPNVAARLQGSTKPNTIVASESTHRLLSDYFNCRDLGAFTFKGLAKPIHVYEIVEAYAVQLSPAAGLPPMVGRQRELGALQDAWRRACGGERRVCVLSGEPGIGKSRLVAALKEGISPDDALLLKGQCSPYEQNSAFYAVVDLVSRALGFTAADAPMDRQRKIEQAIGGLRLTETAAVPLLASLLSVPLEAGYPPLQVEPGLLRQRTLVLLLEIPRALAGERPVLLHFEDVHWADPSTIEYLGQLVERDAKSRVLIMLACRPESAARWRGRPQVVPLDLDRLEAEQAQALIAQAAGGKSLPDEVVDQIVTRTDGVPLFIEETARTILESGLLEDAGDHFVLKGPLPVNIVPASLQDALMARLDRLGTAKNLAQLGATIGREFSYELLQAVCEMEEPLLRFDLERVLRSGLLRWHGTLGQGTLAFKHALVQETAYQSLPRAARQANHQRIAAVIEERFPEIAEEHPELLAAHHAEAGSVAKAAVYWQKASDRSIARAAFAEAIGNVNCGLRLLERLPAGAERNVHELHLQTALGMALQAHRGYAAPEVDRAYARARELCEGIDAAATLLPVLRGQFLYYIVRANYATSGQIAERMYALAERDRGPGHLMEAQAALALNALYTGEFVSSRGHFERALALYDPANTATEMFHYVGHSAAMCHSYFALALWHMGQFEQALRHSREGVELARGLAMPLTVTQALWMHLLQLQERREIRAALEWFPGVSAYVAEHGFPYWQVLSMILQAWLIAEQGDLDRGIEQFKLGVKHYLGAGARIGVSWLLPLLAELQARSGRIDEGLETLAQAAAHAEETGERYYEAEIERLKGELLLTQGRPDARARAEACFVHALEIARRQEAKTWELRAAMSLARLLRDDGRVEAARSSLGEVYATFTEGLDTADLVAANALLGELKAVPDLARSDGAVTESPEKS